MSLTLVIGLSFLAILLYKVYDSVKTSNLTKLEQIKFVISAALILAFITTGYFFAYPQSLYWFIFTAVIILSLSLSSVLVRNEFKRYLALSSKDKIINTCYYALVLISLNIIF